MAEKITREAYEQYLRDLDPADFDPAAEVGFHDQGVRLRVWWLSRMDLHA
jgi:hypothetical protein